MLRKVVQQGPATLMISLPARWARQNRVAKGRELHVQEHPGRIQFSVTDQKRGVASVDISGYPAQLARKVIGGLYKAGYDEIAVRHSTVAELETVLSFANNELIGFEVVSQNGRSLLLKEVSALHPEEFNRMLQRAALFVQSMATDTYQMWKTGRWDEMASIELRDLHVNKLANFCRRAIHQSPSSFAEPFSLYVCVELLEKAGDGYKGLTRELRSTRPKYTEAVARYILDVNALVDIFNRQLQKFDMQRMAEYQQIKDKAVRGITLAAAKAPRSHIRILYTLWTIMWFLYSALDDLFVIHQASLAGTSPWLLPMEEGSPQSSHNSA
ncbi:phosphate uptake regulator PhoU [Candidatus Woesearchaeota archaeon]|nr:phosphate uptake regulator PhoU [Candidatus Woesearchaeota archaeon]